MQNLFLSQLFNDVLVHVICEHDHAFFHRWFMRGVHAVVHNSGRDNHISTANCLLNLFSWLGNRSLHTGAYNLSLAVLCSMICVIDELMLTYGMHELEPRAERTLRLITQHIAENSDHFSLMVQFMSGLAERCSRRQLHSVAQCIIQQMEYVSQLTEL